MIALGVSQAIEGGATTASTVNVTIGGLLMNSATPPVATGYQTLYQGQVPVQASAGSLYNPGGSATALISFINLYNTSSSLTQTVNLYIEGVGAANQVVSLSIQPLGWAEYDDNGWTIYTSNGVPQLGAGLVNISTYIVGTVAISATTFTNITSLSLSAGTWLIFGSALTHLTTATLGHIDVFLGPTSASKTNAYVSASESMGNIAGGTEEATASLVASVTLAAVTTVYLEAYASEATTAEPTSNQQTIPNCTGILAVKIG